jgi:regulator of nonsense transcripts 2
MQYYINTKDQISPDIEFAIQDAFAVIGPDLKLISNLDEAAKLFADAVKQNYQTSAIEKAAEMDEVEEDSESDDGPEDDDEHIVRDAGKSSGEDNEVMVFLSDPPSP